MQCKESICPADNQPFECTIFVWEVLTVCGIELSLFLAKSFPLLYLCRAPDIAAARTILTSLVMTRCRTKIRTYNLPDNEQMRYVLSHGYPYSLHLIVPSPHSIFKYIIFSIWHASVQFCDSGQNNAISPGHTPSCVRLEGWHKFQIRELNNLASIAFIL